nr:DotD/TraH family lipoprotein [Ferrovum sp.]
MSILKKKFGIVWPASRTAASLSAVSLPAVSLSLVLALAGCAPHLSHPVEEPMAAGSIPSVLLRSSQLAAQAQQRVSEVLFVQTHPPVVAIAPSHQKAMLDRFHFHWEGPVNVVAFNLATAMGWSMEFAKPQPTVMPSVYIDQRDSNVQQMVAAINRQIMPTAMLRVNARQRTLILIRPTSREIRKNPAVAITRDPEVPGMMDHLLHRRVVLRRGNLQSLMTQIGKVTGFTVTVHSAGPISVRGDGLPWGQPITVLRALQILGAQPYLDIRVFAPARHLSVNATF